MINFKIFNYQNNSTATGHQSSLLTTFYFEQSSRKI